MKRFIYVLSGILLVITLCFGSFFFITLQTKTTATTLHDESANNMPSYKPAYDYGYDLFNLSDKQELNSSYYNTQPDISSEFTTKCITTYKKQLKYSKILSDTNNNNLSDVFEALSYMLFNPDSTSEEYMDTLFDKYIETLNRLCECPDTELEELFNSDFVTQTGIINMLMTPDYFTFNNTADSNTTQNNMYVDIENNTARKAFAKIKKLYQVNTNLEKRYFPACVLIVNNTRNIIYDTFSNSTSYCIYTNILNNNAGFDDVSSISEIYNWSINSSFRSTTFDKNKLKSDEPISDLAFRWATTYASTHSPVTDFGYYFNHYLKNHGYADKLKSETGHLPDKNELPLPSDISSYIDYKIVSEDIDHDGDNEIVYSYSDYNYLAPPETASEYNHTYSLLADESTSNIGDFTDNIIGVIAFKYDKSDNSYKQTALYGNTYRIEKRYDELLPFDRLLKKSEYTDSAGNNYYNPVDNDNNNYNTVTDNDNNNYDNITSNYDNNYDLVTDYDDVDGYYKTPELILLRNMDISDFLIFKEVYN